MEIVVPLPDEVMTLAFARIPTETPTGVVDRVCCEVTIGNRRFQVLESDDVEAIDLETGEIVRLQGIQKRRKDDRRREQTY